MTMHQSFENEGIIAQGANDNYADDSNLPVRIVPKDFFSLEATRSRKSGHYITTDAVTDESDKSYWVSATLNSDTFHNCVIVTFYNSVMIEAVLIDHFIKQRTDEHSAAIQSGSRYVQH